MKEILKNKEICNKIDKQIEKLNNLKLYIKNSGEVHSYENIELVREETESLISDILDIYDEYIL